MTEKATELQPQAVFKIGKRGEVLAFTVTDLPACDAASVDTSDTGEIFLTFWQKIGGDE